MTPDVNVLVAAARNDHVHHLPSLAWLKEAAAACGSGGTLRLMPMVLASFLRLVTNARVFKLPTTTERAVAYLDALLAVPGVELVSVGVEWPLLRQLCLDKQLAGSALPDARLAAAVVQHGEHLVTFDVDFRKLLRRGHFTVLRAAQHGRLTAPPPSSPPRSSPSPRSPSSRVSAARSRAPCDA